MMSENVLKIAVSDPIKASEGFTSHYNYKIASTSNLPGYQNGEVVVIRRYRDFVWLFDQLSAEYPGTVIPPLPEKQSVSYFYQTPDIDARMRALEKFLHRVANHAQLQLSPKLQSFLQCDDNGFNVAKNHAKQEKKESSSGGTLQWIETVVNAQTHKTELEVTPMDIKFQEYTEYLNMLSVHLTKMSKAATEIVNRDRDAANDLFLFSQGLTGLGNAEADSLSMALIQAGSSIDQLSQSSLKSVNQELLQFSEPLQEYVRMLNCLKAALKRRADTRKAYSDALCNYQAKHEAYSKVAGTGVPQEEEKKTAEENANKAVETSKAHYEKVSVELSDSIEQFKAQKANDLKEIMINWVNIQIAYCKRAEETWAGLIPAVSSITIIENECDIEYDDGSNDAKVVLNTPKPPPVPPVPPVPTSHVTDINESPSYGHHTRTESDINTEAVQDSHNTSVSNLNSNDLRESDVDENEEVGV